MYMKPGYAKKGWSGSVGFKGYGGGKGFAKKSFGGYGKKTYKKKYLRPIQRAQDSSKSSGTYQEVTQILKFPIR